MKKNELLEDTCRKHCEFYGKPPERVAYAPGRVEVLGNHTDYNEGLVLSAAIDSGHCFCVSPSEHRGGRLYAVDLAEKAEFSLDSDEPAKDLTWSNYTKGVVYYLRDHGMELDGLDCTFQGNIPRGAGLSSSAALEVSSALALSDLAGIDIPRMEIAKLCQRAEREFAGVSCGLMDQISSLYGRENSLIQSDFRTLEVSLDKLPEGILFLICNSGVKHSLVDSEYNERRACCESALLSFKKMLDHPVRALRDVSMAEWSKCRERMDDLPSRRSAHVIGESERVEKGNDFLRRGEIEAFGKLMFASHESSINNFENSCEELDWIVSSARSAGALGARLSGGGFGGSAVVMTKQDSIEDIISSLRKDFAAKYDRIPEIQIIRASGAAHLV